MITNDMHLKQSQF